MGGLTAVLVVVAGRASFGPLLWASSRPGLPASVCAGRGQHRRRRFVRGAQRLGATQGSNDRARTASTVGFLRNAAEHPLASLPRDEWKGGGR